MMAMACGSECSECKNMHANSYTGSFPIFGTIYSINSLKSQVSMKEHPRGICRYLPVIERNNERKSLEEISQYFEIGCVKNLL